MSMFIIYVAFNEKINISYKHTVLCQHSNFSDFTPTQLPFLKYVPSGFKYLVPTGLNDSCLKYP